MRFPTGNVLNYFFLSQKTPQPVRIYAEVKKGWNPVRGASVVASVIHPDGQTSQLILLDNGLGGKDYSFQFSVI